MPGRGTDPKRYGDANDTQFIFQTGSAVTTDQFGIQTCEVKALFPFGSTVYTHLPAEGSSFSAVFGHTYLPSSFLLDFFEGAPGVEYLEAEVARVTFKFKRIDPLFTNRRTVSVDSVINYQNNALSNLVIWTGGIPQNNVFGFPDPTTIVTYSTTTQPGIGTGGLANIYALPGSNKAQGFPDVPDVIIPYTFQVPSGSVVSYWDGTAFQSYATTADTTFVFNLIFKANPRGWQLTALKSKPVSNDSFYAVEENWRNFYTFFGATLISVVPPPPP